MKEQSGGTSVSIESSETIDRSMEMAQLKLRAEQAVFCDSSCLFPADFPMGMVISAVDLGKLMLLSNKNDFSLNDDTKDAQGYTRGYTFLVRPDSFRASLVQVAGIERKAFDSAMRTMRITGNDARRIPQIFRNVFYVLETPTNKFTALHLKTELEEVQKAAQKCDALCKKTAEELTVVIDTIKEIKEHIAPSAAKYAELGKQQERDKQEEERKRGNLKKRLEEIQQEIEDNEHHLRECYTKYNEAETNLRLTTRAEMANRGIIIRIYLWIQAIINWLIRRWIGPMRSDEHANVVLAEASRNLTEAQRRNQELLNEETRLKNQLIEINAKFAKLEQRKDEKKIDYAQIEDLLSDDLTALVNHHKGWCKLGTFFQNIEEMVKLAVQWSDELVDVKDQGAGDTIGKIKQLSYESVAYAEMIYGWCSTYICIAESHITPVFDEVVGYLTYENPADVSSKFIILEQMAEEGRYNVEKEMREINTKFRERKEMMQRGMDWQGTQERAESMNASLMDY